MLLPGNKTQTFSVSFTICLKLTLTIRGAGHFKQEKTWTSKARITKNKIILSTFKIMFQDCKIEVEWYLMRILPENTEKIFISELMSTHISCKTSNVMITFAKKRFTINLQEKSKTELSKCYFYFFFCETLLPYFSLHGHTVS